MLAPKQQQQSGHHPQQQKQQAKKPFVLQRQGFNKGIQEKLKIGQTNDKFEKEADSVADKVVNKGAEPNVQKAPAPPIQTMKVGPTDLQKMSEPEEEVQMERESESDNDVQTMSDEASKVQTKPVQRMEMGTDEDETVQKESDNDSDVQLMSDEDSDVQMMSDDDAEVQTKSDEASEVQSKPVQRMEMGTDEDETVQKESDDDSDVQLMSDEDSDVQMMSDDDAEVQTKSDEASEVQTMSEDDSDVQAKFKKNRKNKKNNVASNLKSSKGGGSKMDSDTQSQMEDGFGTDLSGVNIHTDSKSVEMNQDLGSKAFTNGSDIYFNEGQYDPGSKDGQTLLAHELTHTLQQGAVAPGKMSRKEKRAAKKAERAEKKEVRQEARAERKAAKTETKIEKEEVKAAAKATKKAEKAKKKEDKKKAKEEKKEKKKPNPKDDPNFQLVMGNIKKESQKQKKNPKDNPNALGENALEAAESPASESGSLAMAEQVDEMEAQEPKEFDAANFKALVMTRIEEMKLPKNNEEADDFENNNDIDEVNEANIGSVKNETEATAGNIAAATEAEPTEKPEHTREAGELKPAKKSKKPKSVNATKAVPPKRGPEEMEKPLANDTARMDNAMADENVTDEQLAISQEPKFEEALGEKNKAKEESGNIASSLRQKEGSALQKNAAASDQASKEELEGMKALNHQAVGKVTGDQKTTGDKDTSERDRIAGEINAIYETTKTDVTAILDGLDTKVETMFTSASEKAKNAFEDYCAAKMSKYKYDRYLSQVGGWALWTYDLFAGLPDEVNQFYVDGRQLFVDIMDAEITKIANVVATELNNATQRIEDGKTEVNEYVEELPKNLKKFGKEAASDIQDKFDELSEDVNSKQDDLVDMLAEEYTAALEEVDERIEEMKAANRGLIDMAMDFINGVIETIRKLKEIIQNLLSAIMSVIDVIMADPLGFMEMLFDGLAEGFEMFKNNIQNHLIGGLLEWLTGSLGPMGIQMPNDIFSLSGVFDLTLQVLGLGWDYIKLKAVKMMGEPVVNALMTGFTMFKVFATEGAMGIWTYLKDQFQDIKATVIDAIKDMLITKVIEAGVKWLLSLLIPGAGFIKAIMAIKDIIVFFVESAIMLIPAITEAILSLARGDLKGVAKAMEFGLAKLITLVIRLFAKLIGLGGLTKRVMKIFKKIRKRIDKAITKLLRKAKKAARKLFRKKNKKKSSKEIKDENKKGKPEKITAKDKQKHKKINKTIISKLEKVDSSDEGLSFAQLHKKKKKQAEKLENKYQPKLKKGINLDIKFNPVKSDEKDGKIDFKTKIAPNNDEQKGEIKTVDIQFPPSGKAFLMKQTNPQLHFKVLLSNKKMLDLEKVGKKGINIRLSDFSKNDLQPYAEPPLKDNLKVISVKESAVNSLSIKNLKEVWNARGYDLYQYDCFTFGMAVLRGVKATIKDPKGKTNKEKFGNIPSEESGENYKLED